jgi:hypothetical protein
MGKIFFVIFVAALLSPSIVLAQTIKTGREFVMLDGKILAFERVTAKEEGIKPYDTRKDLEEMLSHQKIIIAEMIRKGIPGQINRDYIKNEIARLVREIAQPDSDRRISMPGSNTTFVRHINTERKVLE